MTPKTTHQDYRTSWGRAIYNGVHLLATERRERKRERERQRETETDRDRERQRQTERYECVGQRYWKLIQGQKKK